MEGRIGAAYDVALLLAALPPKQVGQQVARVAARLELDYTTVTAAVVDVVGRDCHAPGRLARRERRDDLDRGQAVTQPAAQPGTAAQLARASYPCGLDAVGVARLLPAAEQQTTGRPPTAAATAEVRATR